MTLLKGTTKLHELVAVLLFAAVLVAAECAAAGSNHPPVAVSAGCVATQCHARLLAVAQGARGTSIHQPAADGECASCHDLSIATAEHFVKGAPAGVDFGAAAARAWDLALCAACHGEGLLAPDAPTSTTGFADGKRNLHALHVQAGRGRRCLPCHNPHAARQAKLLREWIPARGEVRIALEFRGVPNGGWCKTGCHAPKRYLRPPG
jgi:predicted CXXCH cytochrome family protein